MSRTATDATTALSRWTSPGSGWLPTPSGARAAERRQYALWRLAYPIGALALGTFVAAFAWWGV